MADATEAEIPEPQREILAAGLMGFMSTIRHKDGLISTNPVGYDWDGECVRISTTKARVKYQNLVADPRVTFCVTDPQDGTRYVELRGTASIEEDPGASFMKSVFRKSGAEAPDDLDPPGTERVIVRIHPSQVSSPLLYGGRLAQK